RKPIMTPRSRWFGLAPAALLSLFLPASLRADEKEARQPLRVLLFASAATREYQFLTRHLQREEQAGRLELVLCLQSLAGGETKGQPDNLDAFPSVLRPEKPEDKKQRDAALSTYHVVIALDPDWTKLTAAQTGTLRQWVEAGGGLIYVAGPVHT